MSKEPKVSHEHIVSQIEPKAIHTEGEYEHYLATFLELDSRFSSLITAEKDMHELLSLLISDYEKKSVNIKSPTPVEAIVALMEANGLKQKDLVGVVFETASVVSEVLSGKRELTTEHIRKLSRKFEITATIFLG